MSLLTQVTCAERLLQLIKQNEELKERRSELLRQNEELKEKRSELLKQNEELSELESQGQSINNMVRTWKSLAIMK